MSKIIQLASNKIVIFNYEEFINENYNELLNMYQEYLTNNRESLLNEKYIKSFKKFCSDIFNTKNKQLHMSRSIVWSNMLVNIE